MRAATPLPLIAALTTATLLPSPAVQQASAQDAAAHSSQPSGQALSVQDDFRVGWPRQVVAGDFQVELFQPQIESWDNLVMRCRLAMAVTPAGGSAPEYGILGLSAGTLIDKQSGTVFMQQMTIESLDLPGDPARAQALRTALAPKLPSLAGMLSISELQSAIGIDQAMAAGGAQPVRNDPPRFFFSESPALLVLLDGPPALRPFVDPYLRAVNSTALLLLNQSSGTWYLRAFGGWRTAPAVDGPWSAFDAQASGGASVASSLATALAAAGKLGTLDFFDPRPNTPAPKEPVRIFVSESPAEVIETDGPPAPAPIPGTTLLYITNTQSQIIVDPADGSNYLLVSGRWFRSPSLAQGPWTFVPGNQLPSQFAKIPESAPSGAALTAVPGTAQAQGAAIANTIPQTAVINRAAAKLDVTYQGSPPGTPQFRPIEGTPLQYAVNTAVPVIEVDPSTFFAVNDGVWFTAGSPGGPWQVALAVPPVIYTIPVSSPLHYVTYVKVYGADDLSVTVGYTPGYLGTVQSQDGTVVYGTGYTSPGWVGDDVWYGYPWTYGWGAGFGWAPLTGFCWGFNAGRWWGATHPWWGPWRGWNNTDFHQYSWNHFDGYQHWAADGGGLSGAVRRSAAPWPDRPAGRAAEGARPAEIAGAGDAARRANNVYAGRDGNVYRQGENGWQRYGAGGWNDAQHSEGWNQQSDWLRSQAQGRGSADWNQSPDSNRGAGDAQRYEGGGFSGGGMSRGGFSGGGGFRGGDRR
jgi:hypothetical protein